MENHLFVAQPLTMIQKWKQSDEYINLCAKEHAKYTHLYAKGYQFFQNVDRIISDTKANTVRTEFSVKGNMHRGVYCPSPVLDLLVGGFSKGRILKRVTATSKITHKYGFDKDDQLLYVESLMLDGCIEYLVRKDDSIWGISLDLQGNLSAISEESFWEGRLRRYTYAEIASDEDNADCFQMCSEEYNYDDQGLFSCLRTVYIPMCNDISKIKLYTFERQNGYLHSYTAVDQISKQINPLETKTTTCVPTIKRKA